jgi:hypothetical protein
MKRRYVVLALVSLVVSSCASPKSPLIGKWKPVDAPVETMEIRDDGRIFYENGSVTKYEIVDGERLVEDGKKSMKFTISGDILELELSPSPSIKLKYARFK